MRALERVELSIVSPELRVPGTSPELPDVIVHRAPGEARGAAHARSLAEQRERGDVVLVEEEHRQSPVAELGDVVRDIGDDDAGEAGHERGWPRGTGEAIKYCVP